jgi:Glycosyl transferases group 1
MKILCLCPEDGSWKILPFYASAFRKRGVELHFLDWSVPLDSSLTEVLSGLPFQPDYLLHPDSGFPFLPDGITQSIVPTIRLDVDTYAFTRRRIRWASLFDHVAVCHPGFEALFQRKLEHSSTLLLAHAVHREYFELPEIERNFDFGWVGQIAGPIYKKRTAWLPRLASRFHTNDWSESHTIEGVAGIYRRSRIVVNIGRDDFPQDANLRVFEALASGALLLTALPNELTSLGFVPGVHFIGFHDEAELHRLVRRYLDDESARIRIAQAGRDKTLQDHTYDNRVDALLQHLQRAGPEKRASARRWPEPRARLMQLDFLSGHGLLLASKSQFRRIAGRGFWNTIEGAALLARAWMRKRDP